MCAGGKSEVRQGGSGWEKEAVFRLDIDNVGVSGCSKGTTPF